MLILNYHRVGIPPKTARYRGMYVTPAHLAWHIKLLKLRGCKFVTVSEGVQLGCPPKTVAITFDDGYIDNLSLGLPVLQKENVPATVYVVTGDIGKRDVIWPEAGDKAPSDLMSWNELKHLETLGWEIGSHAVDHVHLARRSKEEQRTLIETSWQDMARALGHPPKSFAYPYGSYNQDTIQILFELSCQAAVTIKSDGPNTANTRRLELKRQPAKGYRMSHFVQSLSLLWRS